MIGEYCKSLRHLEKSVEDSKRRKILFILGETIETGVCLKNNDNNVLIFNNVAGCVSSETHEVIEDFDDLIENYHYVLNLKNPRYLNFLTQEINSLLILPVDVDNLFEAFTKSNNKQYTQIKSKYRISFDFGYVQYFFALCNNNFVLFSWAIKNLINYNVPLSLIVYCLKWNDIYPKMSNKLRNGTINAYNGFENIWNLIGEMNKIARFKRANDSINQFNTIQKHLLKNNFNPNDEKIVLLYNKFEKLSDQKKNNFIRKMSTVENLEDILSEMSILCDIHFEWNKKSFLNYFLNNKSINGEIVYDNENVVVVKSFDYETIKRLGKSTNWCISKNKRYWNDYIEKKKNREQYVIFDFSENEDSEYSIIGFTVENNKNINFAHSFTNNNLMVRGEDYNRNMEQFIQTNYSPTNIYSILEKKKIPFDIFMRKKPLPFNWDKDSFLNFLDKNVDKKSYSIISVLENKIAINFHKDAFYFIDKLNQNIPYENGLMLEDYESIFFFDFSKSETDSDKILYSCIQTTNDGEEEFGTKCQNLMGKTTQIHFDNMLSEYNIPFDFIKRSNSLYNKFLSALKSFDVQSLKKILIPSNREYFQKNKKKSALAFTIIRESLMRYRSFNLINLIYESNYKLSDFISDYDMETFGISLLNEIVLRYHLFNDAPSKSDFERLKAKQIYDLNSAIYVAYNMAFSTIFQNEQNSNVSLRLISMIIQFDYRKGLCEYLIGQLLPFVDMSNFAENYDTFINISKWFLKHNSVDFLSYIYEHCNNEDFKMFIKKKKVAFSFV